MDLGTVSFDDLFDFSPEPPQDLGENSYELEKEKIRLSGDDWSGQAGGPQKPPHHVRTITSNHQVKQPALTGQEGPGDIQVKTEPEVVVKQLWEEEEAEPELGTRRGRRSGKPDVRAKLERSRQSARECRARKKLRYQYLDDMILEREGANDKLRDELLKYVGWCQELDMGRLPDGFQEFLEKQIEG